MINVTSKKAEMAIGTLIIFIAMVLVAAIAAGVIIQTATSLQNKALLTGERAKSQVGTGIQTILVYGEDGNDKDLESFFIKMKLSPGSDALKFEDMLLEVDTESDSSDNVYGQRIRLLANNTWSELDTDRCDFNQDELPDYVRLFTNNGTGIMELQFNISNNTASYFILNSSITYTDVGRINFNDASLATPIEIETYASPIEIGTSKFGTFHVAGKTTSATSFSEDIIFIVGAGSALDQGAYAVDYLLKSSNWKEGYLQRGDVIKMVMVAPHTLEEDQEIDVRVIPKTGSPRTIAIVVPDLVNAKRVYMFS